jgi:hypothetical protein
MLDAFYLLRVRWQMVHPQTLTARAIVFGFTLGDDTSRRHQQWSRKRSLAYTQTICA